MRIIWELVRQALLNLLEKPRIVKRNREKEAALRSIPPIMPDVKATQKNSPETPPPTITTDWTPKLKNRNVNIENLCPEISAFLFNIHMACEMHMHIPMTITSGNDSKHMKGSLHYQNRAIDIRTRQEAPTYKRVSKNERTACVEALRRVHPDWDVIDEVDHLHIEYDPK
jgi:hypothetical protein